MNAHIRRFGLVALPLLALMAANGRADIDWSRPLDQLGLKLPETVQIHGFASQSYLRSTANNFFGYTQNMGSLDFTEMGINGSWRPIPQMQTSLQVVYRRAGQTDNQDLRIDFGFLDYSFLSDARQTVGIRLGRVVNPYGLYNDTRDMPFTRPSILLPQSIYFDITRNTTLSSDGIQVYGEQRTDFGDFQLQVNGGYARTEDPSWKSVLNARSVSGEPSWVGRLMYEWQGGRVRLGATSATMNIRYQPEPIVLSGLIGQNVFSVFPFGLPQNVTATSLHFSPVLFSAQINEENWSLTSEYAIRYSEFEGPGSPVPTLTGESYYVQGTYRVTSDVEGFLRYDVLYADRSDRNGKKTSAIYAAQGVDVPAYDNFAKDLGVGLRWDVTPYFMLRGEYHYINGTGWISPNENRGETSQHWSLFGVSASLRF